MSWLTASRRWWFAAALVLWVSAAFAHEVRPALLQISERADGHYDFLWKQPTVGAASVRLIPRIVGGVLDREPDRVETTAGFVLLAWNDVDAGPQGLDGRTLWIDGLGETITDVLVSMEQRDGSHTEQVLRPTQPRIQLHSQSGAADVMSYLSLGIEHILTGVDHLCFVLGLMLLVRGTSALIKAISAFTVAHSITLGASALHVIAFRASIVETLVALSIVCVAVEVVRSYQGRVGLASLHPWILAFCFGLLHGAAFAGALADIGLPRDSILTALLLFNVGVEAGQLLFVAAMLLAASGLARLPGLQVQRLRWIPPYLIGSFAVFWFIDRLQVALS